MSRRAGQWHVGRLSASEYAGRVKVGGRVYYTAVFPSYAAAKTECQRLLGNLPMGTELRSQPLNPAKISLWF